jgi:cytidylate kinase
VLNLRSLIIIESCLEGGWIGKSEIYNLKAQLQAGVSVRIKSESEREGKQINQEIKWMNTVICFTEVRFQRT